MNRFSVAVCILLLHSFTTACTGPSSGNAGSATSSPPEGSPPDGSATVLSASLGSAINVGISDQSTTSLAGVRPVMRFGFFGGGGLLPGIASAIAASVGNNIAINDLIGIDALGNAFRVLSSSLGSYGIKTTTNYLIIGGNFVSPSNLSISGDSGALNCRLLAIRKLPNGGANSMTCLSSNQVGSYDIQLSASNSHYTHLGFDTIGESVYFTDWANGVLHKWTESTQAKTAVFTRTPSSLPGANSATGMADVAVDHGGSGNLCVLYPAITVGTSSYRGHIFCGTDSDLRETIVGDGVPVLSETRVLGKYLVTTDRKIDLTNLSVSLRTANGSNGGLPAGSANIVTTNGGATIHRGYAWSLATMNALGETCILSTSNGLNNIGCSFAAQQIGTYFQTVVDGGAYAWALGTLVPYDLASGNFLARIDKASLALDSTNHIASTGMTSMSNMGWDTDGRIVITGKNADGLTVFAYIDGNGTIVPSSTPPTLRVKQRISL